MITRSHLIPEEYFDSPQYLAFLLDLVATGDQESLEVLDQFVSNFSLPAGACAEDSLKIRNALGKAIQILSPLGEGK